jgi:hypothetical protein
MEKDPETWEDLEKDPEETSLLGIITPPLTIISDALGGVALLAGACGIERTKNLLFADSQIPELVSWILRLSELSLSAGFTYLFIRSIFKVIIGFDAIIGSARRPLNQVVWSPIKWVFFALRRVGNSVAVGIIVGIVVAALVDIALIFSQISYFISIDILILALLLICIAFIVVIHESKSPIQDAMRSRSGGTLAVISGGGLTVILALTISMPVIALVLGGFAERSFGIINGILKLLPFANGSDHSS